MPFAAIPASAIRVASLSNCSRTPSTRRRSLWMKSRLVDAGLTTLMLGVEEDSARSNDTLPLGGKAQVKVRLLLAFSGFGLVHGATEIGPWMADNSAMTFAPCFTLSVRFTLRGGKKFGGGRGIQGRR